MWSSRQRTRDPDDANAAVDRAPTVGDRLRVLCRSRPGRAKRGAWCDGLHHHGHGGGGGRRQCRRLPGPGGAVLRAGPGARDGRGQCRRRGGAGRRRHRHPGRGRSWLWCHRPAAVASGRPAPDRPAAPARPRVRRRRALRRRLHDRSARESEHRYPVATGMALYTVPSIALSSAPAGAAQGCLQSTLLPLRMPGFAVHPCAPSSSRSVMPRISRRHSVQSTCTSSDATCNPGSQGMFTTSAWSRL